MHRWSTELREVSPAIVNGSQVSGSREVRARERYGIQLPSRTAAAAERQQGGRNTPRCKRSRSKTGSSNQLNSPFSGFAGVSFAGFIRPDPSLLPLRLSAIASLEGILGPRIQGMVRLSMPVLGTHGC